MRFAPGAFRGYLAALIIPAVQWVTVPLGGRSHLPVYVQPVNQPYNL